MSKLIAGLTVSLDGFVAEPDGDFSRLYGDYDEMVESGYMGRLTTGAGAVIMGRRTFDLAEDADHYADGYEYQCPFFVVTHEPLEPHPKENDDLTITFVTDGVASAVVQAKAAAGDEEVHLIGGVDVLGQLLEADLVDELGIDVYPILLGDGIRFPWPTGRITDLRLAEVVEVGQRTALRDTVRRDEARRRSGTGYLAVHGRPRRPPQRACRAGGPGGARRHR